MLRNWARHDLSCSNPSFSAVIFTMSLQSLNVLHDRSKDMMNKCRVEYGVGGFENHMRSVHGYL